VIAALSDNVIGLVVGRALQGSGAISSVVLALLADYTRETERSKAMAVIGAVIGGSFVLAVMLGPWIAQLAGLNGLFWFTACLALLGLLVVYLLPPVPPLQQHPERQVRGDLVKTVFADSNVLILSLGIFFLHMTMTALFVALPVILVARGFVAAELGSIYAPVMILAFLGMAPMMMAAEKRSAHIRYLRFAASFIFVALLAIGLVPSGAATAMSLLLFFVGFNFIEATLPSLLSRKVDPSRRGTAMGVFATAQFLGAALGGIAGGLLFVDQNIGLIVALGIGAQLIWIVLLTVVKPVIKADAKTA
jgi:predicted MFS family arabinose efflux permease